MRIVFVWITAIFLTFSIMIGWYILQPISATILTQSENISQNMNVNTTGSGQTFTIMHFAVNVGAAFSIIFVWIWAFISSQSSDWRSEVEGY